MPKTVEGSGFCIDWGALRAFLEGEEGGALVQRVFGQCGDRGASVGMDPISLLWVYMHALSRKGPSIWDVIALVHQLPLEIQEATGDTVAEIAQIIDEEPALGIADASALCLARRLSTTLITDNKALCRLTRSMYVGAPDEKDGQNEPPGEEFPKAFMNPTKGSDPKEV